MCLGVFKVLFRKDNDALTNKQRTADLKSRVRLLLDSVYVETIGKCARRAREFKLSYLSLLSNADSINKDCALRDAIEKMKKETKGKRCMLDQDASVIATLVSLLEDDADYEIVKEKDHFVVDLEKNENSKEDSLV